MATEADALRNAPPVGEMDSFERVLLRVTLQEADEVACAGQPATQHPRVLSTVHHIVDASRFKTSFQRDRGAVHEFPLLPWNALRGAGGMVTHGHEIGCAC